MKNLNYIYLCILLFLIFSCKKESSTLSELTSTEYFNEISLNSYFEVVLIQRNEHAIQLEGKEKRFDKIDFEVKDSVLTIKNSSKGVWLNPDKNKIKLYITFKDLKKINLNESCEVSNLGTLSGNELGIVCASKLNEAKLNLNYSTVYYWNNFPCGGKIELSGNCSFLKIWNFALMQIDAKNLLTEHVLVENSSKGDCSVYTNELIEYSIFGEGNVKVFGNPTTIIKKEVTSNGKLILE
ncbi:MAG: DUF2807 domain-containing protein [Bacteroidota bacterium]